MFNAQSIKNKLHELQYMLHETNCDCLWNIIRWYGRHILSKTSKQSKVYKYDLL